MNFIKGFFKKTEITFVSDYPIEESVRRLKEDVNSGWNPFAYSKRINGWVFRKWVCLYYSPLPFTNKLMTPWYVGSFRQENGRTVLSGYFALPLTTRIFAIIWFGGLFSFPLIAVFAVITSNAAFTACDVVLGFVFFSIGAFLIAMIGVLIMKFSLSLHKNDIPRISQAIKEALSANDNADNDT